MASCLLFHKKTQNHFEYCQSVDVRSWRNAESRIRYKTDQRHLTMTPLVVMTTGLRT